MLKYITLDFEDMWKKIDWHVPFVLIALGEMAGMANINLRYQIPNNSVFRLTLSLAINTFTQHRNLCSIWALSIVWEKCVVFCWKYYANNNNNNGNIIMIIYTRFFFNSIRIQYTKCAVEWFTMLITYDMYGNGKEVKWIPFELIVLV